VFERGMVVTHDRTGKPFTTKYAHSVFGQERETLEEAFPGDVVGFVNATDVRVGDTLWADEKVTFPTIPSFAPEHFAIARTTDVSRSKQFRNGITQLDEEGVVQVLRDPDFGEQAPVLAAVGALQFEVAKHRLESEFGAPVELTMTRLQGRPPHRRGVAADAAGDAGGGRADAQRRRDARVVRVAYWLDRLEQEHPELTLERLIAEGELRQ
jgi:peptide chain release factor 3